MTVEAGREGPWPALWAGVECTVNRVGDDYFHQLERNGHATRPDDLERIAALGVRALRFPLLWELTAPDGIASADWRWADPRLARLRELGITPIAGLVHHGSGPRHTHLASPCFAPKLAEYAAAVARRYPWITHYTPVNEPLTTARFAGLYGAWYPHGRHPSVFKDAILNECRATVLAMREIRRVNSLAQLVATDDLGKYYGTPLLRYQVDFQNELRWLGWDLLAGRVTREHPLWGWLTRDAGAREDELLWFAEHPCPPSILGANHYVTSERYIDERLERFPAHLHGGNGRHRYADVEVARALARPTAGLARLLHEAWQRYRLPIAITEVHLDATRDDQIRWLAHVWRTAVRAHEAGIDVRAVTVWALFGSFDWNCIVTACRGYYEPGAFDVRSGTPRPTAIAHLMRHLAHGHVPPHPVLAGPGWWHRPGRHFCEPVELADTTADAAQLTSASPTTATPDRVAPAHQEPPMPDTDPSAAMRPLLIIGATGTLGQAFARICEQRGLAYRLLSRRDVDIADASSVARMLGAHAPWAVLNAAGYVRVDDAERDAERCFRENALGPATLAAACARHRVPLVTYSSDLVFDGRKGEPYHESDRVAPLSVYGESKARAEAMVLDRHPRALVVRTSAFFGPWDRYNHLWVALDALSRGDPFVAAHDLTVSPTYVPDLVHASLDLLVDKASGLWHLSNGEAVTWAEFTRRAVEMAGLDARALCMRPGREMGFVARRPAFSALGTSRSHGLMPSLDDAMRRFLAHRPADAGAFSAAARAAAR